MGDKPVTIEEVIGREIKKLREEQERSLAEVGEALGEYLGKPWSPQGVWQAEKGKRDFKIAQLVAFSLVLKCPLSRLVSAGIPGVQLSDSHVIELHETARLYAGGVSNGLLGSRLVDLDRGLKKASADVASAGALIDQQRQIIHDLAAMIPENPKLRDLSEIMGE